MTAPHPSTVIDPTHTAILRDNAAEAEALGQLNADQLALVYQLQWFKLLVPWVYGGQEKTLPELVRLQEAISWADGSAGWVVTLCCGAGWFGGFINPAVAAQVFNTPELCLAGSGAESGEAEMIDGGYRLSGTWRYASGAYHATHFTANCMIKKDGEFFKDDNGKPWILPFIVDKKDVTLHPTWKYVGMVATGSHSFQMDNVEVADDRCFHIDAAFAEVPGALYQYPFLNLAEATLAVNLSGMAMHFVDLCHDIFEKKMAQPKLTDDQKAQMKRVYDLVVDSLQTTRDELFAAVDQSWSHPGEAELKAVSKTSRHLAITARESVDLLYPYCGLMAASPDTELNRVWRDMHTAGQHSLLTFAE